MATRRYGGYDKTIGTAWELLWVRLLFFWLGTVNHWSETGIFRFLFTIVRDIHPSVKVTATRIQSLHQAHHWE